MNNDWINARNKLPNHCLPYLCYLCMNDQGDYAPWFQVLYYDVNRNNWSINCPLSCEKKDIEYLSNWHTVTHWIYLPEPPNE